MLVERIQELQRMYGLEQDPRKKREILEQLLDLNQAGLEQLFVSLSKEEDPQRLLLLLADLNRVLDGRRCSTQETASELTE